MTLNVIRIFVWRDSKKGIHLTSFKLESRSFTAAAPSHAVAATALMGTLSRTSMAAETLALASRLQSLTSEATYLEGNLLRCTLSSHKEQTHEPRGKRCVRQAQDLRHSGNGSASASGTWLAWEARWPVWRRTCNKHSQGTLPGVVLHGHSKVARDTRGGESAGTSRDDVLPEPRSARVSPWTASTWLSHLTMLPPKLRKTKQARAGRERSEFQTRKAREPRG